MPRIRASVGGALLAGVALSGCQGIAASLLPPSTATASVPSPRPTSATPTTSATTTSKPTPIPAAAKQKTKAGSAAFVSYFWAQFNRSQMEPNPDVLRPLFLDSCAPCGAYVSGAEALVANRQRYADPPFVVRSVKADTLNATTATVVSDVDQQAATVVDPGGAAVATATERRPQFLVTLTWSSGWKVTDIQVVT
jgi:hypothetical protein